MTDISALQAVLNGADLMSFMETMKPFVDKQINRLAVARFKTDPLLGERESARTSIFARKIQIDLITVFDHIESRISAYEIKRGFGLHDAGKTRQIKRDLHCVQLLLKSYGEHRGFCPMSAHAWIIFYFGQRSIKGPMTLCANELDEHFNMPVLMRMEAVDQYFREELHKLVESI